MVSVHSCQISIFQDLYFKKYEQNNKVLLSKPVSDHHAIIVTLIVSYHFTY